jgi:hypothetical protein
MDEATKIIIGTLSGFIIAFLAEPVKIYFQNVNKLSRLRKAFYKELHFNYLLCKKMANKRGLKTPPTRGNLKGYIEMSIEDTKSQYYEQIIQSELDMFYQIEESTAIHNLHGSLKFLERRAKAKWINELTDIKNETDEVSQPSGIEFAINEIAKVAKEWCEDYVSYYYLKILDKNILKNIAKSEDYKEIISSGKQAYEARSARYSHLSK